MNYIIEKYKIPIIFLDTSFFVAISKSRRSGKNDALLEQLYSVVANKVSKRKLICPEFDQFEELHLGHASEDEYNYDIMMKLSRTIKSYLDSQMLDKQIYVGIQSFLSNEASPTINSEAFFYQDPLWELEQQGDMVIGVIPQRFMIDETQRIKSELHKDFQSAQKIHLDKKTTLRQEYLAERSAYLPNWIKLSQQNDLGGVMTLGLYTNYWRTLGGNEGLKGFEKFVYSDYFYKLPIVDISSWMLAYLMVNKINIDGSHRKDVELISMCLPICDFAYLDRQMCGIVTQLKLDKKYSTKIFSRSRITDLINEISKL